ncbi:type II secretion system protein [Clostridium sp. AM58-1XD]|uniref:type II secretion system protein n=1 Tax=Clostridium sp. AM58-1XD TaxID=2292307 RepID=UPI000E4E14F3|nr:type II secretion system protein [Clostridium sp. AM58-1XD]RGY98205.1 type II secretion system protein [Clostridium sp. AM58-1XD]
MRDDHKGFTLLELVIAMTILTVIVMIGSTAAVGQIGRNRIKRHETEAQAVYGAVVVYMDEATSRGTLDELTLYGDIMAYPLGDEKNKLYNLVKGMCPKDAKITKMSVDRKKTKVTAIVYKVGDCEVEIRNGRVDR